MKCNTRRAKLDRVTEIYQTLGNSILAYLDASTGCIVTELYGYKRKRLQEMYDTTNSYLGYMMDQYGAENDDNKKRAANALKKCKEKMLEFSNFDFDEATAALQPEDIFGRTWHNEVEIHKHETRAKFMADMEPVAQTYHAEVLHWFWLHKGFGRDRLMNLYSFLRQDYNFFVTEYLRCNAASDKKIQDRLKDLQDRLEKIGMEFTEARK